jgi:hypothetical protein
VGKIKKSSMEISASKKPVELLSKHLFWDMDANLLEWEKSKSFIIQRALEYGLMKDWECILRIYSLDVITKTAQGFRTMNPKDLNFIATLSNTPKETFRCYNLRLSTNQHWIY